MRAGCLIKDEKGWALPLALLVLIVLTLLGTALFAYSSAETRQVTFDEHKMKAHYFARSGTEIGFQLLVENYGNPVLYDDNDFYLYGELDNGFTIIFDSYEEANVGDDVKNASILISVAWEGAGGQITSVGNYKGTKDVVNRLFALGKPTEAVLTTPPSISDDVRGLDTPWFDESNGRLISGNTGPIDGPVIFTNDNNPDGIIYRHTGSSNTFTATAMYFLDDHSLEVRQNGRLNLKADYFYFRGIINCKDPKKDELFLYTNNSQLEGSDLGLEVGHEDHDKKFGLIYIGEDIRNDETIIFEESGFHYFPNGIQLGDKDELSRLIEADINTINFEKIGITSGIPELGTYN